MRKLLGIFEGGQGSGNFGHSGRIGLVGGSGEGIGAGTHRGDSMRRTGGLARMTGKHVDGHTKKGTGLKKINTRIFAGSYGPGGAKGLRKAQKRKSDIMKKLSRPTGI